MTNLTQVDINNICKEYGELSIEALAKKYKIGDRRVKKILANNGIEVFDSHKKTTSTDSYIEDNKKRFPYVEGKKYVAVLKDDNSIKFDDYLNKGGALIHFIKETYGVTPPSLFLRKKYFHENGKQWHERWFDIVLVDQENKETKKCPYCDWETTDINNLSGMFMTHLQKEHQISIEQYLSEHPEDSEYFSKQKKIIEKRTKLENPTNYVVCPICGEKLEKITYWHVKSKHGMEYAEFREKYPNVRMLSDNMIEQAKESYPLGNLVVSKNRFISKYEEEIRKFLQDNGVKFDTNRQILIGKEIDILIEDKKIGIEFDGLKWHTEWFGKKSHNYHLDKTLRCNEKGYGLIHIFEDEYVNHKEIVESKLAHIIGFDNSPSIMARKCEIQEIFKDDAQKFLNKNHIQGFTKSTVYLGAFYQGQLIAVMSFKNGGIKDKRWELTRFATSINYKCTGIGSKLFRRFIKLYEPQSVISFADRRWTININDCFYTKLGFKIESINRPDYKYYNEKVDRYKRFHKLFFTKQKLNEKYGFPLTMTETEMVKELGYDRIWDCGLIRYVWKKENQ